MLQALLICSDDGCTETFEAWGGSVAELESLACDCGCALAVWSISEVDGASDELLELQPLG